MNQNDTVFQFIISQSILLFCFKVTPHAEVLHHGVWKRKTAVWGDVFVSPGILLNTCVRLNHQTGVNLARSYKPPKWLWKYNDVINRAVWAFVSDSVIFSGQDTVLPRTKFLSPYRRQFTNKKDYSMKCIFESLLLTCTIKISCSLPATQCCKQKQLYYSKKERQILPFWNKHAFSIPSETHQLTIRLMVTIAKWADKVLFFHYDVLKAVTRKILTHTGNFFPKNQFMNAKRNKGKKDYRDVT